MKACIQRVGWARVRVAGEVVGEVGRGILVLLGVAGSDGDGEAELLAQKTAGLRMFED
ncbi:MAG: D-tyrosyl-tRNA(Tyr) deacylase, partial [Thermogutta sp.]|nr:D-tyrosyl-tRNA(Tyr) deacylase [Thermogutta sp.]